MKIIAVGRNYSAHAEELNNEVPEEPVIFLKPDTALLREDRDFYYPKFSKEIHYEVEIVLRVCKEGKHIAKKFSSNYYDAIGLGIDFTARDLQTNLKEKGLPWELAKSFDHSAVISPFIPKKEIENLQDLSFSLLKNRALVQEGNTKDMIFDFAALITHISKYITLRKGDLIYTGTPSGVGPVQIGDVLEGFIQKRKMFTCHVK